MRMRYERRDPRAEDLREIAELKSRCDAQDRDLRLLTETLRELQMEQQELQQSCGGGGSAAMARKQKNKKSKLNCDVIYEENEERESPPNNYRNGNFEWECKLRELEGKIFTFWFDLRDCGIFSLIFPLFQICIYLVWSF